MNVQVPVWLMFQTMRFAFDHGQLCTSISLDTTDLSAMGRSRVTNMELPFSNHTIRMRYQGRFLPFSEARLYPSPLLPSVGHKSSLGVMSSPSRLSYPDGDGDLLGLK